MTDSNEGATGAPWAVVEKLYTQIPTTQKFGAFVAVLLLIGALLLQAPAWLSLILLAVVLFGILWCVAVVVPNKSAQSLASVPENKTYSAFISSQMDSLESDEAREKQRETIASLKLALQGLGMNLPAYHAASDRPKKDTFSLPRNALTYNWDALRKSERFIAILAENGPSSSHMEIGAALALKIPSLWLVREGVELPFLMREGDKASNSSELPDIRVEYFSELGEIEALMKQHGIAIFS